MSGHPTNRSTPVPGHRRLMGRALPDSSIRGAVGTWRGGYAASCACGWVGETQATEDEAVVTHTDHKAAVRSGEWARLFEANAVASVLHRAEPWDLIAEVQERIEVRNAEFIHDVRRRP